jgi:RNA polymerase primary sigma factor
MAKEKASTPRFFKPPANGTSVFHSHEPLIEPPEFDEQLDGASIAPDEEVESDLSPGDLASLADPLRLYLREMASVPMLTREQEVAIARRVERGRHKTLKAISRSPVLIEELIEIGKRLRTGDLHIREVMSLTDPADLTEERLEESRTSALQRITAMKRTYARAVKLHLRILTEPRRNKALPRLRLKLARIRIQLSLEARAIHLSVDQRNRVVEVFRDLTTALGLPGDVSRRGHSRATGVATRSVTSGNLFGPPGRR